MGANKCTRKDLFGFQSVIKGVKNQLYKSFISREKAIADLKQEIPDFLQTLSVNFNLAPLNHSNWSFYRTCLNEYVNENTLSESECSDYVLLTKFFDVYENTDKNSNILEFICNNPTYENSIDLALLMPFDSPIAQQLNNHILSQPSLKATIHIDDAVDYAVTYATDPNEPTYDYFSGSDCANFISQILEAGGVNQEVYDSVHSGWWHTRKKILWWYQHDHSRSWTLADTFARYMGIGYSTTSHRSFSANIARGDFIALDSDEDGDWDHLGFVTYRYSFEGNYSGKTYYNYKVAQHSGNYHALTSSSTNGWENYSKYARVRR